MSNFVLSTKKINTMTLSSTQKITPYLWFDNQALEAATFYCSLFDNAEILSDGDMIVEFSLEGMRFMALNGGPQFKFTEAISFFIRCENQEEVDHFWENLTADGGAESMCGWCKDKYGLSWQVVPKQFMEMMKSGNPEKTKKVMDAMMSMKKMIVADFEKAYNS